MRALVAALLLVAAAIAAAAAPFPALTGRVVDQAGLIDDAGRAAIEEKLAAHEAQSSDQVVVATIATLNGDILEDYANRLFRHWGLGRAGQDNGVLLLIVRDDRKVRIEVGYGLEGTLTDLHAKLIIDTALVPAFRAGDYSGGIAAAVDDILLVLSGNGEELEARARRAAEEQAAIPWEVVAFVALWFAIAFGAVAVAVLPPWLGQKIGPRRYRWLGMTFDYTGSSGGSSSGWSSGGSWSSGSSSGGFSGGGGSSGGGGASGSW